MLPRERDLPDPTAFTSAIVDRARGIVRAGMPKEYSPQSIVASELALVLDQFDRLRHEHQAANERLTQLELDLETDLLQMESRRWWYDLDWEHRTKQWNDRQRLLIRRATLVFERSRQASTFDQKRTGLEERVLTLVQRLRALGGG